MKLKGGMPKLEIERRDANEKSDVVEKSNANIKIERRDAKIEIERQDANEKKVKNGYMPIET